MSIHPNPAMPPIHERVDTTWRGCLAPGPVCTPCEEAQRYLLRTLENLERASEANDRLTKELAETRQKLKGYEEHMRAVIVGIDIECRKMGLSPDDKIVASVAKLVNAVRQDERKHVAKLQTNYDALLGYLNVQASARGLDLTLAPGKILLNLLCAVSVERSEEIDFTHRLNLTERLMRAEDKLRKKKEKLARYKAELEAGDKDYLELLGIFHRLLAGAKIVLLGAHTVPVLGRHMAAISNGSLFTLSNAYKGAKAFDEGLARRALDATETEEVKTTVTL